MERDGLDMNLNVHITKAEVSEEGNVLCEPFKKYKITAEIDGKEKVFEADAVLNGTGAHISLFCPLAQPVRIPHRAIREMGLCTYSYCCVKIKVMV